MVSCGLGPADPHYNYIVNSDEDDDDRSLYKDNDAI